MLKYIVLFSIAWLFILFVGFSYWWKSWASRVSNPEEYRFCRLCCWFTCISSSHWPSEAGNYGYGMGPYVHSLIITRPGVGEKIRFVRNFNNPRPGLLSNVCSQASEPESESNRVWKCREEFGCWCACCAVWTSYDAIYCANCAMFRALDGKERVVIEPDLGDLSLKYV